VYGNWTFHGHAKSQIDDSQIRPFADCGQFVERRFVDKWDYSWTNSINDLHVPQYLWVQFLHWKEQNQQLLFVEDWKRSSSIADTAPNNTWYNDHVMRPRSYSMSWCISVWCCCIRLHVDWWLLIGGPSYDIVIGPCSCRPTVILFKKHAS